MIIVPKYLAVQAVTSIKEVCDGKDERISDLYNQVGKLLDNENTGVINMVISIILADLNANTPDELLPHVVRLQCAALGELVLEVSAMLRSKDAATAKHATKQ